MREIFSRVFSSGTRDFKDAFHVSTIRYINIFISILPAFAVLILIIDLFQFSLPVLILDSLSVFIFLIATVLLYFERYLAARALVLVNANLLIFLSNDSFGNASLTHFSYILTVVIPIFMFPPNALKAATFFSLVAIMLWFFQLGFGTSIVMPQEPSIKPFYPFAVVTVTVVIISTFFYFFQFQLFKISAQLAQRQKELLYSSRLASLGEMAAGIAHEVNNPLMIISGASQLLAREIEGGRDLDKIAKQAARITDTTFRISKVISSLMQFSRNAEDDQLELSTTDYVVNETVKLCGERLAANGVELRIHVQPGIPILCRPIGVEQVLLNLINNSFDAISESAERWIEIRTELVGRDKVKILVTDSGSGIPGGIAKKVMTPFFTTKPVGKGTGLGLSVSYGIISAIGGNLFLNEGFANTQFVIELPLQPTSKT